MKTILSFYTWWSPENDLGPRMHESLDRIRSLGFDCISYDIQYTWLRSARETWEKVLHACEDRGISTVPVVSYGFLPGAKALSELTGMPVSTAVNSAGSATDNVDVHDLANTEPLVEFLKELIDTYRGQLFKVRGKILLNFWEPSMVDWGSPQRRHLGYDPQTVADFRRWASAHSSIADLNLRWVTNFPSEEKIQPPTEGLWDARRDIIFIQPSRFWDDWCVFRGEVLARFYAQLFTQLKKARKVHIAIGLSQHGVVTQHDCFHQRCVHLPLWRDVPADRFIVSDDMYCKSASEVKTCMEAELALFKRYFGRRISAFVTPVEGRILVERPAVLYSLCREFGVEHAYLYAWNEMGDGANIRDHPELWPEISRLLAEEAR